MSAAPNAGPAAPKGRREARKHVTRRELLAAGRRLFGEQGLYESRIEDLSRHAGIAKGTLYGYFDNKEQLIEAVVSQGFSELLGHAHRSVQAAKGYPDSISRLVSAHFEFFGENPDLMRIFHQVRGLLKFNRSGSVRLRAVLDSYLTGLGDLLALHHPDPKARGSHSSRELAVLMFGAISGISSMRASLTGSLRPPTPDSRTLMALEALVLAFSQGHDLPPARPAFKLRVPRSRPSAVGTRRG